MSSPVAKSMFRPHGGAYGELGAIVRLFCHTTLDISATKQDLTSETMGTLLLDHLEHRRVGKKQQAQLPGTKYHTISKIVGPTSERLERTERELEAVTTALDEKRVAQQASEERLCELEGVLRGAVAEQSSLTDMASCP